MGQDLGLSVSVDSGNEAISFTPGVILGDRFQLIAMIARGGMGEVYRADDLKLGQPVALKFLPAAVSGNAEALRRLSSEVRLGRQVAHPNVCRLYDLAEAQGQHFIVMELVDGEDLGSLLARIGRIPGRKAAELARDLCAGLAACHDREVVHGDLKPGNVMIDGKGHARIMDFGLSTLVGTRPEDRLVAGTLAYMAPEQLHGGGPTARADIYALGLVLYEMFTGRRVHDVNTIDQLRVAMGSLPTPPSALARVPRQIEEAILQCLERKPARRPRSAGELATVFPPRDPIEAAIAAGETPSPAMVAAAEKAGDLSLRAGWLLFAGAIASLLLSVAGAERFTAIRSSELPLPPESLAEKAREVVTSVAFVSPVRDESYGFTTRGALRETNADSDSTVAFFFRQSSERMTPVKSLRRIGPSDPPLDSSGMALVGLDSVGWLRYLRIVPAAQSPGVHYQPVEWNTLFSLANLDATKFTAAESGWIPPVPFQEKREWNSEGTLTLRAARYSGRAVYFDLLELSSVRPRSELLGEGWTAIIERLHLALLTITVVAAALLARRNRSKGRSDFRGARRVAGWVLACRLLYWLFSAQHLGLAQMNTQVLVRGVGHALFESAQVWLAYVALEPFVRRRWPRLIIGWNRLIDGRFTDPLVGRDFLVGGLFGISLVLVEQLRGWSAVRLGFPTPQPHPLTLEMLSGAREVIAGVFYSQARSLVYALLGLFLFLLLRAIVSKPSVAGMLWILAAALTWSRVEEPGTALSIAVTVAIVQAVLSLIVLVRYGLLASIAMFFAYLILVIAPLTFDFSSWYGSGSTIPMLIVFGMLTFGFRLALRRTPLFGRGILEA